MKNTKIKNIIRQTINEQGGGAIDIICEPTSCTCVPWTAGSTAIIYNGGQSTPNNQELCYDDLNNCCNKYDCDPSGSGICTAFPGDDPNALYDSMGDCQNAYPNGCTPDLYTCRGCQCTQSPSGTLTLAACQNLVATNDASCCPHIEDDYNCKNLGGAVGFTCVVQAGGPFTGPNALSDCQTAVTNNISPCNEPPDAYECNLELCQCNPDPNGQFTGANALADCNAALSDPASECCCINCEQKFNCIPRGTEGGRPKGELSPTKRKVPTKRKAPIEGGDTTKRALTEQTSNMICVGDPAGPFTSMIACQDCVNDPMCPECNEPMGDDRYDCLDEMTIDGSMQTVCVVNNSPGQYPSLAACQTAIAQPDFVCEPMSGGWDCLEGQGCVNTGSGPYPNQAACEADIDDHFNFRQGCDCQCQGCNGVNTPGCAPAACTVPMNSPIPNDDPALGPIGSILDLQQLLTTAFKTRMAPCVPHQGAKVTHDCKFWKFISEVKMPQTRMDYVLNHPTSVPQFPLGSQTAHPRWQRKIEAKIAYLRCLRQQCCMNTQWVDTAYAGGYTHTLTDATTGNPYGAGAWIDSAGVWQPPL